MATKTEEDKEIVYYFIGDGSQVISDAPSEDITEEMWQQLPKHVQRSVAGNKSLYRRGKGNDGSGDDEKKTRRGRVVAVVTEERKEKGDKAE